MIKLILTSQSSLGATHYFDQSSITIGNDHSLDADLKLKDPSLQDRHLQITKDTHEGKTSYFVINLANDPSSTLNNLPFKRQPLHANDCIQIGIFSLYFQDADEQILENSLSCDRPQTQTQSTISDSKRVKNEESLIHPDLKNFENLALKKYKPPTTQSPLEESQDLAYPSVQSHLLTNSEKTGPGLNAGFSHPTKLSLKDDYLSEYDDNEESPGFAFEKETPSFRSTPFAKSWRTFLIVFPSLLGIVALIASLVYLWVSDQTGEEENKAAKGIADIAMSLTYAQLKHIHSQNQNWSHPEFIKTNLTSILASSYIPLAEVDTHGQFANCPYLLRIYTSSDLSQFLVIAQPSPSLLQWLIPKASIIIDSRVMEMRKIKDLKALNRLIVNSNSLEGTNANEISNLIKQGELIPLASLASKAENQGLTPPKALRLMRPGTENFIYNAPRYYLLGETILNRALELVDQLTGMKEIKILQQELNALLKFPDFVLYSSAGIQHALRAQKALTALMPNDKFLIAYLQLNSHGKIINSHLLMSDTQSEIASAEKDEISFNQSETEDPSVVYDNFEHDLFVYNLTENQNKSLNQLTHSPQIDRKDPLFFQLCQLANSRHTSLKPVADEIIALLKKESLIAQVGFISDLTTLQKKYEELESEQKALIFNKFTSLIQENSHLSAAKFSDYVQLTGLSALFQDYLLDLTQNLKNTPSNEEIEHSFREVRESMTWEELEQQVIVINELLQFKNISNQEQLIALQNVTHSLVLQKLNQFILSPGDTLPQNTFNANTHQILKNILQAAWVTDPDTKDFYMTEFSKRMLLENDLQAENHT